MKLFGLEIKRATQPTSEATEPPSTETRSEWAIEPCNDPLWTFREPIYAEKHVTAQTAQSIAAVYACVKVLSESVAGLPLKLYRTLPDGSRQEATDHPLHPILRRAPNSEQSAYEFWEMMVATRALTGNAFALVQYNGRGEVVALWPVRYDMVRIERDRTTKRLIYKIRAGGKEESYDPVEVFHYRGRTVDGVWGLSPISYMRQSVGTALATEEYAGRFFSNDASPGGWLEHPNQLSDEAVKRLRESIKEKNQGARNAHSLMILEEGMKFNKTQITPEDSQFLETRKFQVREVARFFRMPPHMIQDLEQATFSNIEEQALSFLADTLQPWLVSLEQTIHKTLLSPSEQQIYYPEFLVDAKLRTKTTERFSAYAIALNNGWMTPNEVRERENLNRFDGGDTFRTPLNMSPAGEVDQFSREILGVLRRNSGRSEHREHDCHEHQQVSSPAPLEKRALPERVSLSHNRKEDFAGVARTILASEIPAVRRLLDQNPGNREALLSSLERYYEAQQREVEVVLAPVYRSYADEISRSAAQEVNKTLPANDRKFRDFMESVITLAPKRWIADSSTQLRALLEENPNPDSFTARASQRLDEWEKDRAEKFASYEANRVGGAIARASFIALGFTKLASNTPEGSSCPYCHELNGKVVGVGDAFLSGGDTIEPEGLPPMRANINYKNPPYHQSCDCWVSPA